VELLSDPATATAPQKPPRRFTGWLRRRWRVLVVVATVFILVVVAGALTDYFLISGRIRHVSVKLHPAIAGETWLVIGSDSRTSVPGGRNVYGSAAKIPGQRADVVLLVHSGGGHTSVLSVPRDLLVSPKPGQIERLTLTFLDGPQSVVDSLCNTLGVAVNRLVEITMGGFAHAVDAVGGITVTIRYPIRDRYTGLNISRTGRVHVNGTTALALVRSRHPVQLIGGRWVASSESAGAADRTSWAGTVFAALQHKARDEVPNPFAMQRLAWTLSGALITDRHTGLRDLFRLRGAGKVTDLPAQSLGDVLAVAPDAATSAALAAAGIPRGCH
jgi:LCP family protein required for cell wall assembly